MIEYVHDFFSYPLIHYPCHCTKTIIIIKILHYFTVTMINKTSCLIYELN